MAIPGEMAVTNTYPVCRRAQNNVCSSAGAFSITNIRRLVSTPPGAEKPTILPGENGDLRKRPGERQ